ncbi:MAG: lipoprotein insertase outer membrane protein LolB [Granulosicoccus sp.]
MAAAIWVLYGCAAQPTSQPVEFAERNERLKALTDFAFSGGLGIWTDDQSVSARVQWRQSAESLTVRLAGPMGIGNMELVYTGGVATLSRAGRVIASGPRVDEVLQSGLGLAVPVPVEQLKSWVLGLRGDATSVVADEQGKLVSLRFTDGQDTRWQARFLRYADLDGVDVPALITASGGEYSVRLVLKNWQQTAHSPVSGDKTVIEPVKKPSNTRLAIPGR